MSSPDRVTISYRASSGQALQLKAEPAVLRSFLTLLERGLEIRVGKEETSPLPSVQLVAPLRLGTGAVLCPAPGCNSGWKNQAALRIHIGKAHPDFPRATPGGR